MKERLFNDSVGLILQALSPLVAHDVLLGREIRLIELVDQVSHSIRLQPEGQLELIRGNGFEVVRAVEIRRAVDGAGARAFQVAEMLVGFHVLRSLKHHVLEQVSEAGPAGLLVGGTNVVPEIDRCKRESVILGENDLEPIRELILLEDNVRDVRGGGGLHLRIVAEIGRLSIYRKREGKGDDSENDAGDPPHLP